jgi:tetratricopeptide (TPR) repeat protein
MKLSINTILVSTASLLLAVSLSAAPTARPAQPEVSREMRLFDSSLNHLLAMRLAPAQRGFERVLRMDENFAEAHVNLAFVLRKQGEDFFERALLHYNQAIELNEELAEAYMYRGVLFVKMGEIDKALQDHARLLELNEDFATELQWVVENGREKEPEQFFGIVRTDAIDRE